MSTEVVDVDQLAGPGLALDETHALVAVEPEDLEALWRSDAAEALGWLLFRSGPAVRSSGTQPDGQPPELWFEIDGRRVAAELREAAGWGEQGVAAVALFEVRAIAAPARRSGGTGPATCGIRVGGKEIAVELPGGWVERLRAAPGGLG
ncbi:MAG: hypothetical protein WA751_06085 [Candidatus Dormiibacterota bacterium]